MDNTIQNRTTITTNYNLQKPPTNKVPAAKTELPNDSFEKKSGKKKTTTIALIAGGIVALGAGIFAIARGRIKAKSIEDEGEEILDKFYLGAIEPLFKKYGVSMDDDILSDKPGGFGVLENAVNRQSRNDFLKSLCEQDSVESLIDAFKRIKDETLDIPFDKTVKDGPSIDKNYLENNINFFNSRNEDFAVDPELKNNPVEAAKALLKAEEKAGKSTIVDNFGPELEKLEELHKGGDPQIQKYFEELKEDLAFHVKLLSKGKNN